MNETFNEFRREYQHVGDVARLVDYCEDQTLDATDEIRFELDVVKHMLFTILQRLGIDYYEETIPDVVPEEAKTIDMEYKQPFKIEIESTSPKDPTRSSAVYPYCQRKKLEDIAESNRY